MIRCDHCGEAYDEIFVVANDDGSWPRVHVCGAPRDLMDRAMDAMERGDHAEGIRLARAHNNRMQAVLEAKYGLGACTCGCITPSQTHLGSCPLYEDPNLRVEGAYEGE